MDGGDAVSIPDIEPGEAVLVDWPADRYFASAALSRSELWLLHKDPPRYHAIVVERSMSWPESKDMKLGTLIHLAVLEPALFMSTVRVRPDQPSRPRPKKSRDQMASERAFGIARPSEWGAYDEAIESLKSFEAAGGTVLSLAQATLITGIAQAVKTHHYAADLLELPGANEQTILWREPDTGILCRVRLDSLRELGEARVIADLKSTRDPEPEAFGRSIAKLGYDFQAAFYTDAVQALFPGREIIYAIIAAGKDRPLKVSAAPLATSAIEDGRRMYRAALADLVKRRQTNNWRELWQDDRDLVFDKPKWAYPK